MSLQNHPKLKLFIQKNFPRQFNNIVCDDDILWVGDFNSQQKWNLRLEIEENGYYDDTSEELIYTFTCLRTDCLYHIEPHIIYAEDWIVPHNYDYIMKHIDIQMKNFMTVIHNMTQCLHCGEYITLQNSFDNKCISCGLQTIYDENTGNMCSICLEPVGCGKIKQCKNKHYMHYFCFIKYNFNSNKNKCPLRCGSIIE